MGGPAGSQGGGWVGRRGFREETVKEDNISKVNKQNNPKILTIKKKKEIYALH